MQLVTSRRLLASAAVAGSLVLFGTAAQANSVYISLDGTNDVASGSGSASTTFSGSFNGNASASGLPNTIAPELLDSSSLVISAGNGGSFTIYISETDLTGPIAAFQSTFNASGTYSSITETTYLDLSNAKYGTGTQLGSEILTGNSTKIDPSAVGVVSGSYSLTQVYTVTLVAGNTVNASIDISAAATPLPAALPLFGSVLGGGLLLGRLRKKKRAA